MQAWYLQAIIKEARASDMLSFQTFLLTLHVLDNNVIDITDRLSVFQDQPRFIRMEMDLDQCVITDHQQAVSLEMFIDIVMDR